MLPVRGLADQGIVNDLDPYNLKGMAWSSGVNVRFTNGSIERAPVFRDVDSLTGDDPRFLSAGALSDGTTRLVIGYLDGRLYTWANGTETNASISGYTDSDSDTPFTSVTLGDIQYINRADRVPWYITQAASSFSALGNWNTGWRANLLRSCGGALVALGVTKSGTLYPTMVKTSSFAEAGSIPDSWDETDPSTNATENVLGEMKGLITDASNLGEALVIYGRSETWMMRADGSNFIFQYEKLFNDAGVLNANCSVEVDNKHYVFGPDDIWVHDGVSRASICEDRTRRYIYNSLDLANVHRCFVVHHPSLKEIYFCYVSGDDRVSFINGTGCNRAAVFNYASNVWTYYDLPFIHYADRTTLDPVETYATINETYATVGGTYLDQQASIRKTMVMVGDAANAHSLSKSLYAFDLEGPGSTVPYAANTNATKGWTLTRNGIDLDEVGAELRGYKCVNSIYPQGRLADDAEPIEFRFGAADYFNEDVEYSDWQTYDGGSLYKLDYFTAGRYLSLEARHEDTKWMKLTGFDLDMDVLGDY